MIMAKNNKQKTEKEINKKNTSIEGENEFSKLIKIIIGICIFFTIFYILTTLIQKMDSNKEKKQSLDTNKVQYDEILLSRILDQPKDDYYVLIESKDEKQSATMATYVNQTEDTRIYTVDLGSAFNQKYWADTSNFNVTNMDEFKVKGTTLLHIQNHQVIDAKEDINEILKELQLMR